MMMIWIIYHQYRLVQVYDTFLAQGCRDDVNLISIRQLYSDPDYSGEERDDTPAAEGAPAALTPPPVPNDGSTGNPSISGGRKR